MKSTRRLAQVLLMLFVVALPGIAEKVGAMPAPTGYIDDYAEVLSSPAKSEMEAEARELHYKTRAQIFLVTINTLEGEPVETFANELFAKWKIGEKKTDRGVLMLFAIKDHKRWIEVGYGLEGILNDAKVGDIGREMVPALRVENYDKATKLGLDRISNAIAAESGVSLNTSLIQSQPDAQTAVQVPLQPGPSSSNSKDLWGIAFPVLWCGIILFIIVRAIKKRMRTGVDSEGSVSDSPWSDSGSNFSSSDDSFSGGDGGSSGGGGAGGDW